MVITVLAYTNSFSGAFLFDDGHAILSNPQIQTFASPLKFFTPHPPGPVITFTLAVNYALGGFNPWGYHAEAYYNLALNLGDEGRIEEAHFNLSLLLAGREEREEDD